MLQAIRDSFPFKLFLRAFAMRVGSITIQEYQFRNVAKCLDNDWPELYFLGNQINADGSNGAPEFLVDGLARIPDNPGN